ncbi:MAG: hypothetical protein ACYCO9_12515 [Streptosporangiaceae bacterium]
MTGPGGRAAYRAGGVPAVVVPGSSLTAYALGTKAPTFAALFRGVTTAVASHPAAVSMSWGIAGEVSDETYYEHFCAVSATVCVVSSGDYGHPCWPRSRPALIMASAQLAARPEPDMTRSLAWAVPGPASTPPWPPRLLVVARAREGRSPAGRVSGVERAAGGGRTGGRPTHRPGDRYPAVVPSAG